MPEAGKQRLQRARHKAAGCDADFRESAPIGCFTLAANGAIREVNRCGAKWLGAARGQLAGRRIQTFMTRSDRATFTSILEQVFKTRAVQSGTFRLENAAGASRRRRFDAWISRDGRSCHTTVGDATANRSAEEALRECEQRLRAVRDASPDAFFLCESVRDARGRITDFRIIDANDPALEFAHLPREELIGSLLCKQFPFVRTGGFFARGVRVVETGKPLTREHPLDMPGSTTKWIEKHVVKAGDGVAAVFRDVTGSRRAEEALKSLPRRLLEAQELERRRFARELHDGVSQLLVAISYRLHALERAMPDSQQHAAAIAHGMIDRALREVRRISQGLRPSALDDLGLVPALRALAAEFRAGTGRRLTLRCPRGSARLPANIEEALYRIAQEALTNIERHAAAHQVAVRVTHSGQRARMSIRDDGRGLAAAQGNCRSASGFGLLHMRHRAELAGGTFALTTARGRGTEIVVEFPLPPKTPNHGG